MRLHHKPKPTIAAIAMIAVLPVVGCGPSQQEAESPDDVSASSVTQTGAQNGAATDGNTDMSRETTAQASEGPRRLEAAIESKSGSTLVGKAELTEVDNGVRVVVRVDLAEPGLHGVHVHETADCSAPDASSAGGHFNPNNSPHALPPAQPRHLGDLGNMGTVAPEGRGALDIVVEGATLEPGVSNSFVGRALIVHSDEDTGAQPSGNSGKRVGCAELISRG